MSRPSEEIIRHSAIDSQALLYLYRGRPLLLQYHVHHLLRARPSRNLHSLLQPLQELQVTSPSILIPLLLVSMVELHLWLCEIQFSPVRRIGVIGPVELVPFHSVDKTVAGAVHNDVGCADPGNSIVHQVLMG